jgi:long-chain acyl-CoA synthetase
VNIVRDLERWAEAYPDQPAILFDGERISYRELDRHASAIARWLETLGIHPGDRVALFLPNIPAFVEAYYGAMKAGAVVVSISAAFKAEEIEYIVRDSGARVLFTTEELHREAKAALPGCPALERLVICEGTVQGIISVQEIRSRVTEAGASKIGVARFDSSPAAILYTSGTTGKPKGAVLTHGNVVSNMHATAECTGMGREQVLLLFLPLFHCFGQNFIMNGGVAVGATLLMFRRFDREEVLAAVRAHGATMMFAVPTIYIALLNSGVTKNDLGSIRYYFSAAATMPEEIAKRWWESFGRPIHEGYGLTETSPFAAYNHAREYRSGSIGTPIPGVEMRVVDEADREVPRNSWGEIVIRGPNVMLGYFQKEAETAEALRGGWFHSGDIGFVDDDGYFHLVDRVKDMINAAGFKVWPREVEELIYRIEAVKEVAVVGLEDDVKGEVVAAFIVKKPGAALSSDDVRAFCKERIAGYKVPKTVEIVDEIPKSPTGKILKRVLRGRPRQ